MQKSLTAHISLSFTTYLILILTQIAVTKPAHALSSRRLQDQKPHFALDLKNATLREALEVIGKKSNYGITYNDADLPGNLRVNYTSEEVTVEDALSSILKNTGLTFREYKNNIVIHPQPPRQATNKGSIEGTLYDAETNEVMTGANVRVLGTSMGSNADANGRYSIKNIPEGTYQLAISFIGYETAIVRDITVTAEKTTTVDYKLKPSGTQLQAIEVIGNRTLSGNVVETNEVSLVNEIKTSNLIITGISAQQIARSVDQDAGEVARRLPGVSLLNNFVNIRGMHERYNLTYLNGMIAPSSEADRRAFSYDLLPSNMIDKMTVYRSPGPELLGDWAGGVIKVETKNTSIARQFEAQVSAWYRPESTFENFHTYEGGKQDWLGRDDGTRALPGNFPAIYTIPGGRPEQLDVNKIRERDPALIPAAELVENAQLARKMYSNWNLQKDRAPLDFRAGLNYYDSWKLGNMRLNNLTSINTTQATQTILQTFQPAKYVGSDGRTIGERSYEDTISRKTARWGLLQNLKLQINPRHAIELKGLYNQLGVDETMVRNGSNNIISDFDQGYSTKIFYTYRSRSILSAQLAGSHTLGEDQSHLVSWSGSYSRSSEDVPAQRLITFQPLESASTDPNAPRYLVTGSSLGQFSLANSWYYLDSEEDNITVFADYEKKFGNGIFARAGFFNEKKDRSIDSRLIAIGAPKGYGNYVLSPSDGNLISDPSRIEDGLGPDNFKEDGSALFITDNEYSSGQYAVSGNIVAGYGAVNIPLLNKKLNIYGGIRYEGQDLKLTSPGLATNPGKTTIIDRYMYYWLPSVNVTWNFTSQILARAAYGKTLNRPNYRELVPIIVNDPRLELEQMGTDTLGDAEIHNFDLRFEWYPSEGEFVSVGGYYKKLTNAIEPYIFRAGNRETVYFSNTPGAFVYGVEVEIRKSLRFIPARWAQRFSVIANLAFLDSEVEFEDGLVPDIGGDFGDNRTKTRPLEGTASYVINGGLYYDHEEWGTKISALYNVLGQRLVYAGTVFFPETYELPRHQIDLSVRQRLSKHLELRAGIQDILNQPRKLYRDYDRDQKFDPDRKNKLPHKDWVFQEFKPGSYYMIGVNLTF